MDAAFLRASLRLPRTAFPMRANAVKREVHAVERLTTQLYERQWRTRVEGQPLQSPDVVYVADGPPYANGSLHMGHALNKVIKDVISRRALIGRQKGVNFTPGWDCHGLPIEQKALAGGGAQAAAMAPADIRAASAELALGAVAVQAADCKRWGVLANWDDEEHGRYLTLKPQYEAAELEVFRDMVAGGHIFRALKPVYWSPSSRTALAEAELEYVDDHVSQSIYVGFRAVPGGGAPEVSRKLLDADVRAAVWTTTPWTLPSNVAICVHADMEYVVVDGGSHGNLLVASTRVEDLGRALGWEATPPTLFSLSGTDLAGCTFQHPVAPRVAPVLLGDHVTDDSGTGLVHTAPGHGVEDFDVCAGHGLPVLCPVDDAGLFTADAGPGLEGLDILTDGNSAMIQMLQDGGALLHHEPYLHRYPYDWRTKAPVVLRATEQWFARVDGILDTARRELQGVTMVPPASRNRLEAMLSSRSQWCISRQRCWGVPIPVMYNKATGEALLSPDVIDWVIDVVRQRGAGAWWDLPVEDLLPPGELRENAHLYQKGGDTLDVWFDSGSAWKAVWEGKRPPGFRPADVVVEGSDQHRGWFQSSLLTAAATVGAAPYKTVITHGFVLDEAQRKMSKSLGNIVSPMEVVEGTAAVAKAAKARGEPKPPKRKGGGFKTPYGVDVMRYWVASTDFTADVALGPAVVASVSDGLRKVRNTCRFLLGNVAGYSPPELPAPPSVPQFGAGMDVGSRTWSAPPADILMDPTRLTPLDRYALLRLADVVADVNTAYDSYGFARVVAAVAQFTSTELSSRYLDMCKDRLYADAVDAPRRASSQAILFETLRQVVVSLAPIVPFTAEDVYQHHVAEVMGVGGEGDPLSTPPGASTVFDVAVPPPPESWRDEGVREAWGHMFDVQAVVNTVLERARKDGQLGSSLEASVGIVVPAEVVDVADAVGAVLDGGDLCDVLSVSQVDVRCGGARDAPDALRWDSAVADGSGFTYQVTAPSGVQVTVTPSELGKCERCWQYAVPAGHALCPRCLTVIPGVQ